MSGASSEKLVYMANQIGAFFDAQGENAALHIADHLASFWAPPMRRQIIEHLDAGGAGLKPSAAEAVRLLKAKGTRGVEARADAMGETSPGRTPGDDAG